VPRLLGLTALFAQLLLKRPYQGGGQEQEGSSNSPLTQENLSNSPLSKGGWGGSPLQPQDLTVCDPACGSGHILVYGFTLLFLIYKEQGYLERDIPELILTHNLYGLDIDERAAQLARFAVLMKARAINSRIFRKSISLNITVVRPMNRQMIPQVKELNLQDWYPLIEAFKDADNLGSLITPPKFNRDLLQQQLDSFEQHNPLLVGTIPGLKQLLFQADLLSKKYWVVVTNPPYMGSKRINAEFKEFLSEKFKDVKSDLFSAFMVRTFQLALPETYIGFVTPFVWMFLSSYEKIRITLIKEKTIYNLVKPSYTSFFDSAIVPLVTFVVKNCFQDIKGVYVDLGYLGSAESQPIKLKEAIKNTDCGYLYYAKAADFAKIPGSAIAYWASKKVIKLFEESSPLHSIAVPRAGMITSNNYKFIRLWHEIYFNQLGLQFEDKNNASKSLYKWFPYQKGGEFRRWYGNLEYVVNWYNDGWEIRNTKDINGKIPAHAFNDEYIFKPNVNWTSVTSSSFSVRITEKGMLFDAGGSAAFPVPSLLNLMGGYLNSKIANHFLNLINPTLNFQAWNIGNLPIINLTDQFQNKINTIITNLYEISRQDWDNFETSWDFQTHPLLRYNTPKLSEAFKNWQTDSENAFQQLKQLEEENNKYWIEAYGLQDELTPEVPDNQITIRRADPNRDICSLISYAIGCLMGRYSLDKPGLIHAGQPFDPSQHTIFAADIDAILPITDQAYFEDDIVNRFIEFISITYSPQTLTENLDFIADTLTRKSGETSRDRIRRYFLTEFISNHIQTYKKRPIYWLFTSGKNRAFNALVYLHRYSPDTLARLRTDYVLQLQVKLDGEISRTQKEFENGTTSAAKKAATKRLKQLQTQQLELRDYQALLQTKADARIQLDLDDGVAYNYTRFKGLVYEGSDLKMADLEKAAKWKLELLKVDG